MTRNFRFDQDRPACAIRTDSGGDFALDLRSSISFRLPSTCSRRDFCWLGRGPERTGDPVRVTVSLRFSACRSPDRIG